MRQMGESGLLGGCAGGYPAAKQVAFFLRHVGDVAQRHDVAGNRLRMNA